MDTPDDVQPTPAPTPKPAPEPETVTGVIKTAGVTATAADFTALANAFDAAVSGIDRGTITTPAGARETFRALWLQEAARTNPEAIGNFAALLDKLSGMIDYTDLASVRKDFAAIAEALKARAEAIKPKAATTPVTTKTTRYGGGCANGQCSRWGW